MGRTLLLAGTLLLCWATGGALQCCVCEVGNPYEGCVWGQGTCTAPPGGVCWSHVAAFGPLFSLSTLGCNPPPGPPVTQPGSSTPSSASPTTAPAATTPTSATHPPPCPPAGPGAAPPMPPRPPRCPAGGAGALGPALSQRPPRLPRLPQHPAFPASPETLQ
ncbi:4-O-methyl-glucuronoyl methylesterase 1-like [Dermochelys coriacea]|uniref:4-O-methyl-glucuronoyl methylesterase 1-like n=1 Tax=Dermochelys coriacea TaxID=27794 RepID=UPI001CA921C0|nr:4-O-methyl-glucuronoyl methylesterase 1-like [Dermochelys coriacea]